MPRQASPVFQGAQVVQRLLRAMRLPLRLLRSLKLQAAATAPATLPQPLRSALPRQLLLVPGTIWGRANSAPVVVTDGQNAVWFPDGSKILFSRQRSATQRTDSQ